MQSFLFLRPELLLLFVPLAFMIRMLHKRQNIEMQLERIVDRDLLKHLIIKPQNERQYIQPLWLLAATMGLMIIALAGPSWQLKPDAMKESQTRIAAVMKVTESMQSSDLRPSRLKRAVFKLKDLFDLQSDMQAMLIAYSGSAHLVMPMSKDAASVYSFADALEPSVMPIEGDNLLSALMLADTQLHDNTATTIVFCDSVSTQQIEAMKKDEDLKRMDIIFYAVGSPELLDIASIQSAANAVGGSVVAYSPDGSDLKILEDAIAFHFRSAESAELDNREDGGYQLLPIIFILMLLLFRKGVAAQIWRLT